MSKSYPMRSAADGPLHYEVLTLDETPHAVVRRGRETVELLTPLRTNLVHVAVYDRRRDEWRDLGTAPNLRTVVGLDWEAGILGGITGTASGSPATATSATTLTATGTPWSANAYKGWRVVADNGTGAPVYGNIGSNTSGVLTLDQWWNANDTTGATPASTAAFGIVPGQGSARFIGLTDNTATPLDSDISLAGELTSNGLSRALGTYTHTSGVNYYTLTKTFTYTGSTLLTVAKAGTFTASTLAAGGLLVFETLLPQTATVTASGDQIAFTWTVNI